MSMSSRGEFAPANDVPTNDAPLIAKPERLLAGFPWVSAIVLYTLSWGWALLRPNTLYWDDWDQFPGREPFYFRQVLIDTGRPLWEGVIEGLLIQIGVWAICLATFLCFFLTSIFFFGILKKFPIFDRNHLTMLVLLFLIVPVNHARISLVVFDYTSGYFLFFLGWMILVHQRSRKGFALAIILLFLSLKTHSLLFYILLPLLHFIWLKKRNLTRSRRLRFNHLEVLLISLLPLIYLILRQFYWPPISKELANYHKVHSAGLQVALLPIFIGLFSLVIIMNRKKRNGTSNFGAVVFVVGFLVTALALFPYFAGELYVGYAGRPAYLTVFEFRADWRSRHQLLMPLGLALSVVGLNELLKWRGKNIVVSTVLVISVALNMFWGSQYFLQSHKQEQLVELFKTTKDKVEIALVEDQTQRFNGRESTFRGYEWSGFMTLAGIPTDRPGCEALPSGSALTLKSDTSYLQALATRDLGLYFDVKPCSEVLAQNN
jgi:hypothetical protein